MADETAVSPPKKKKLPFKPTALRRAAAPSGTASDAQKKPQEAQDNDDALELFRRTKEMAPIMAADRERRLLRKQKHLQEEEEKRRAQEQRRQPPAGEKRALDEDQASEQTSRREEGDGEASTRQLDRPRDDEQHSSKTEASKTLTAHSSSFRFVHLLVLSCHEVKTKLAVVENPPPHHPRSARGRTLHHHPRQLWIVPTRYTV